MTPETDPDLVRRCLDGDRTAWADLLGRFSDLIYGLLRRSGLTEATAADAFQEISLLLWKHLKRLRSAERLLPFIATTTRRVAWRMKKYKAREGRDRRLAPRGRPGALPGRPGGRARARAGGAGGAVGAGRALPPPALRAVLHVGRRGI
jgi:DNA-directed RNA polymerase specialized sigma24 family protein